jgi:hypothetical protein
VANSQVATPLSLRKLSVPSGDRDGIKDQLVGGDLEISADGKTFRKVASFAYGAATVELDQETKVKALRVVATEDQNTWVILRDPIMR